MNTIDRRKAREEIRERQKDAPTEEETISSSSGLLPASPPLTDALDRLATHRAKMARFARSRANAAIVDAYPLVTEIWRCGECLTSLRAEATVCYGCGSPQVERIPRRPYVAPAVVACESFMGQALACGKHGNVCAPGHGANKS